MGYGNIAGLNVRAGERHSRSDSSFCYSIQLVDVRGRCRVRDRGIIEELFEKNMDVNSPALSECMLPTEWESLDLALH